MPDASSPDSNSRDDAYWLRYALDLAAKGQGSVEPNPMVGCVLVHGGRCIGQGYHAAYGGPHAEVEALRSIASGDRAEGAVAYVTLEPCCHHGKTPPCTEALIRAGVRRVVIAMRDPFEEVDGGGIARLRGAGIEVTLDHQLTRQAQDLNAPYLKRLATGRPWVIAKWAMTADGRVATVARQSQWISGATSRHHVHLLRGRVDAIVAGTGTVLADDPMLTARLVDDAGNPQSPRRIATRVILAMRRLPPLSCNLVRTADRFPTALFAAASIASERLEPYRQAGLQVVSLGATDPIESVGEVLGRLGQQGMTNVMLEAGPTLMASFFGNQDHPGWIDEWHVFVGAKLFGGQAAPGPIGGSGVADIDHAKTMRLVACDQLGDDVRLTYRRRDPEATVGFAPWAAVND